MGLATGRDLHIDQNLTNVAINYRPRGMIADMIAPIVPVNKETNVYPVFNQAESFAVNNTYRARGTPAQRVTRSVSSAGYNCKNYALAYGLPIEDTANMDDAYALSLGISASYILTDGLMLDWDRRVLTMINTSTSVGSSFLCGSSWAVGGNALNYTGGDPISQLWRAKEQQNSVTGGYAPNRAIFGWQAWNWFRRNPMSRAFVLGTMTNGGMLTRESAAAALELDQILVAEAFYNSANEAQSASYASTFPKDAVLLYYSPSAPSLYSPAYMYSFRWTAPELGQPFGVFRHPYDTVAHQDLIEAGYYQDEKIVGAIMGHMITGVGSAQANGLT
jgi:hypothetical protein